MNILYNNKQFFDEVSKQREDILSFEQLNKKVENMNKENKSYSIFTVLDAKVENYAIVRGIKIKKSIGYYVLEGDYLVNNGMLEK